MLLSAAACPFSPVFLAGAAVCGVLAAVCGSVSLRRLRRGRVRLVVPAHLLLVRLAPGFVAPIDALLVRLVIGCVGRLASGAASVLDQVQAFGMRFAGLGDHGPIDAVG